MDLPVVVIRISNRSCCIFAVVALFKRLKMKKQLFATLISLFVMGSVFAQCPMCKTALTSGRDKQKKYERQVGDGLNGGILFLMSVPYVLAAGAGFAFYKNGGFKKKD